MQQFNLNELYLNDNNSSTYIKNIQLTKREELSSHQHDLITNKQENKILLNNQKGLSQK